MKTSLCLCALIFSAAAHAGTGTSHVKLISDSDPVIASMKVSGQRYLLERIQDYCAREVPASAHAIQAARTEWIVDHSTLLEKVPAILRAGMTPDEYKALNNKFRADCDESDKRLSASTPAERTKWCMEQPKNISSPEMYMMNNRELVNAIAKIDQRQLVMLAPSQRSNVSTVRLVRFTSSVSIMYYTRR